MKNLGRSSWVKTKNLLEIQYLRDEGTSCQKLFFEPPRRCLKLIRHERCVFFYIGHFDIMSHSRTLVHDVLISKHKAVLKHCPMLTRFYRYKWHHDISPTDTSPRDISPTGHFTDRHFANRHFADGHSPTARTFHRQDISPSKISSTDISPTNSSPTGIIILSFTWLEYIVNCVSPCTLYFALIYIIG